jgi:hypothetical protein
MANTPTVTFVNKYPKSMTEEQVKAIPADLRENGVLSSVLTSDDKFWIVTHKWPKPAASATR